MNANDCGLPTLDYSGTTNGITDTSRLFKSPLYGSRGSRYLPDTDCTYTIRNHPSYAAPAYFLVINFLSSVTFDVPGVYPDCTDYLETTIGERNSKTIKYCGDKIPYSIYSHEGVIKIRVVAASSSDGGVFQFEALARKRDFGSDCLHHRDSGSNGLVISPNYPFLYSNGTCDKRIFVGSKKDIDIHFIDINLKSDSGLGQCKSGSDQDHIEIRGSLYVTSSFDDATPLGEVKCGNVSQVYSLKKIQFDYVHIRFHGNKMATGYRGMYAVYNIYDTPKKPIETENSSTLLWVCIVCGIIVFIIVIWVFIYKALNSKKHQRQAVGPASAIDENGGGYVPNIPMKNIRNSHSHEGGALPSAPPAIMQPPQMMTGEPDYNPAELFAAVKHRLTTLPDAENPAYDSAIDGVLFPGNPGDLDEGGFNDVTAGLSPGYQTSANERQTSGLMNT